MAQQGKKKRPSMGASASGGGTPVEPAAATGKTLGGSGSTPRPAGKSTTAGTSKPAGKAAPTGPQPPRTAVGSGPKGSSIRRNSTAANRPKSNNMTQLYILASAVGVIIAVVIIGIVWNKSSQSAENDGYGTSKNGIAAIDSGGVIGVAAGNPPVTIDIYEDPICPYCGAFERQYGQQIAQAIDEGKLKVNYHLLNFLDGGSASGDYSTRASAALMCAASNLGPTAGAWSKYHETLYAQDVQPEESGSNDHTNDELNGYLADAAVSVGLGSDNAAVTTAQACVTNGDMLDEVKTSYDASAATLTAVTGGVRSPVVLRDGVSVNINETTWLTSILA